MHTVARCYPRHHCIKLLFASAIVDIVCAIFESKTNTTTCRSNSMDEGKQQKRYERFCCWKFKLQDTEEFKKILKYFNEEISPSVCILTFVNLCCSISGILWLLNYDRLDKDFGQVLYISIVNVCLWIFIAVAPFVQVFTPCFWINQQITVCFLQAAKLTSACEDLCKVGHEVRIKPFFHQDTPGYELDSALLYASTLKINARLFAIPIYPKYLCLILLCSASVVLILGQIHFLSA